jgi:ABC-type lipoprotein export system ATPase subunit
MDLCKNVSNVISLYYRCEIPVIIMGETGCGKTRLIKFMCALQQPPGVTVENMILMKVSNVLYIYMYI